jgi:uncharacterized protein YqkB
MLILIIRVREKIANSLLIIYLISLGIFGVNSALIAQPITINYPSPTLPLTEIKKIAQATTVRLLTNNASGSGVIINKNGDIYTVITNWHVVSFSDKLTILTSDKQSYSVVKLPQRLGNQDLAIVQFRSQTSYQVSSLSNQPLTLGEKVFAVGFPMYQPKTINTTFDQGIKVFHFTEGVISLLPNQSLAEGYDLGYTNDIVVGMSGGGIFNEQGLLIGINGRVKNRDPDFGVYVFADGTEPEDQLLENMLNSSWGIKINNYLQVKQITH